MREFGRTGKLAHNIWEIFEKTSFIFAELRRKFTHASLRDLSLSPLVALLNPNPPGKPAAASRTVVEGYFSFAACCVLW